MQRDVLEDKRVEQAINMLVERVNRKIQQKGKGCLVNTHEAFGKIYEEVHEAATEMHQNETEKFKVFQM